MASDVPMAMLRVVTADRLLIQVSIETGLVQVPRTGSLCFHAVRGVGVLMVNDAGHCLRFRVQRYLCVARHARDYASAAWRAGNGGALGTPSMIDRQRRAFDPVQCRYLAAAMPSLQGLHGKNAEQPGESYRRAALAECRVDQIVLRLGAAADASGQPDYESALLPSRRGDAAS